MTFPTASTTIPRPSLESQEFQNFLQSFRSGNFERQRLGQAFYNHFSLGKMRDTGGRLNVLYEMDGDDALSMIHSLFDIQAS